MRLGFCLLLLFHLLFCKIFAQCPEIASTAIIPNCIPNCELCVNDIFTVNLTGFDLPNGGKLEYYLSPTPGFNPYQGAGAFIGSVGITTPGGNCRICPELMGFLIDACGTEQNNEFIIMWTGSGFNTSNFVFDYAAGNNTGGAQNADIGGGCTVTAGGASSVGGCMATQVGAGFDLPANAVWVIFTSSAVNFSYDFSSVCALGLKVYVSKSSCARSIGSFTNGGGTGTRTQGFSISGCACSSSVTYDLNDPNMMGNGDAWAGGISNGGCSATISGAGNYVPAMSTITPFKFKIPDTWCDKTFEIVGIVNPKPDPMCCKEIFTERFTVSVKCPIANKTSLEVCDDGTGKGKFILEDAESRILGSTMGGVEWFSDILGNNSISSPYISIGKIVYARIKDGNCTSPLVPIELKLTQLISARGISEERCAEFDGLATFPLINLENFIQNGNNNFEVKFYDDINKSTQIFPPIRTASIIIYATSSNGDCESLPVEIRLIVNSLPIAKDINRIGCPEADGNASFDLNQLIPYIKDSIKNNTIVFFKDSTLMDTAFSPFRTDSAILYAVVSNGKCKNSSKIFLRTGVLKFDQKLLDQACEEINGEAIFTLIEIIKQIQSGDTGISVTFYSDSTLNNPIVPPIKLATSQTIYSVYKKAGCISLFFPIQLDVVKKPQLNSIELFRCAKSDGSYDFDLDSIIQLVYNQPGVKIEIYKERSLINKVKGLYTASNDTLFTIGLIGSCVSDFSTIILHAQRTPEFERPRDTSSCKNFILDSLQGKYLSFNASYYSNNNGNGIIFKAGDTINSSRYIYRYDNNKGCVNQDSFRINIFKPVNAGMNQILSVCEGSPINLKSYISNADTNGVFLELVPSGRLNKNIFSTTGLNGKTVNIKYTVPATLPCLGDTANIQINIVKQLSAGLDTIISLCSLDSVDLFDLLRLADPGGQFFDQSGKRISSKIIGTNFGFGQYDFIYTIGDGINCPISTSTIGIIFRRSTLIDQINNVVACKYFILETITGLNTFQRSAYFTQPNRNGNTFKAGDTIFNSINLYVSGTDLSYCTNEIKFDIQIVNQNTIDILSNNHCPDYFLILAGNRFDINNPKGMIVLKASSSSECDTIYNVQLGFLSPSTYKLNPLLCKGEFVIINGNRYDELNPTGIEILTAASSQFCDSTIFINLNYYPISDTKIDAQICKGDSLLINGKYYNENVTSGQSILQDQHGCDSIVNVRLQFLPSSNGNFRTMICPEDSLVINGTSYSAAKLSGTEVFQNRFGCDSTVDINLQLYPIANFVYRATICPDEDLIFGSTVFNFTNPGLKTLLKNASQFACDSLVDILLDFYKEPKTTYNKTLCRGDSIIINKTRYDQINPAGIEVFQNATSNGCDSTVQINLQFINNSSGNYNISLCDGDSLKIGNQVYSKNKIQGQDTLIAGSFTGCDSITTIQIRVLNPSVYYLTETLCPDEKIIVNGKTYDSNHRNGQEIITGSSSNGCDSTVFVDLDFANPELTLQLEYTIQLGDKIEIVLTPNFVPNSILWSPSNSLSCTDCLNPIANPTDDTEYLITLMDENGCTIVRRIKVFVNNDIEIHIPNVFSPNGDFVNDKLNIVSNIPDLLIQKFMIFDRWGEMVYKVENQKIQDIEGWNGEFRGEKLNPAVYVYYVQFQSKDGVQKTIKGDVTLLR
ncbi:MAG: gliding motility-associated C-terminal domain-containing protein [Saprospiraceae bacterium]